MNIYNIYNSKKERKKKDTVMSFGKLICIIIKGILGKLLPDVCFVPPCPFFVLYIEYLSLVESMHPLQPSVLMS